MTWSRVCLGLATCLETGLGDGSEDIIEELLVVEEVYGLGSCIHDWPMTILTVSHQKLHW